MRVVCFLVLWALTSAPTRASSSKNDRENALEFDESEDLEEEFSDDDTLTELYDKAVQAYLEEDWARCIVRFNTALRRYKEYKKEITACRRTCRETAAGSEPIFAEDVEDLHFYEKKVRETLCLLKCNRVYHEINDRSKKNGQLPPHVEMKFVERRPYEYQNICYYQRNRFQEAANAIFTFLVIHPKHEMSLKNLRYYLTLPGVKDDDVLDLEAASFVETYINGVSAYDEEDYVEAVGRLEKSLREFMTAEEDCRFYCEGPFNQGWNSEFTSSVANHFAYCLKCKRSCSLSFGNINGEFRENFLPSYYHYLQFAYYKLGKLKQACAAVESYLLFLPGDETMLQNREYYSKLPKVKEEYFMPREEALKYVKRQEYELRLLNYISEEFVELEKELKTFTKKDEPEKPEMREENSENSLGQILPMRSVLHPFPGMSPSSQLDASKSPSIFDMGREEHRTEINHGSHKSNEGIRIIGNEEQLGGKLRYAADGFLSRTECAMLLQLAGMGSVEGDGYDENKSPHSPYEKFEGLTIGRAALMVYYGILGPQLLELFLTATEAVRHHVVTYFYLKEHLYFTYTHLVCRSALPDSPPNRQDLSHVIHADNCIVKREGNCSRESPAYVWRDYSAILYLNDDFQGGEFIFSKDNTASEIQGVVKPSCGRMVAFSADDENLHGVRGILKGKRCALALWFTFNKKYLEVERILAKTILKRVQSKGSVQGNKNLKIPEEYEDLLIECFKKDEVLERLLKE
ncbi:prolyl 3-hydroxylase 2 [Orussus abietinus]|uniref:prolyl 3-hydroxylase 2 n=1 Tax=Orussus abietinus TaxID=222816 RepID=UPI000625460C|nr:prolyl 3-hydroxylase 2 [Orussus abietinus]